MTRINPTSGFSRSFSYLIIAILLAFLPIPQAAATIGFDDLADFTSAEGNMSEAPLLLGTDGNFYGTASSGGAHNHGSIFKITPAGVETTLYSFTGGNDGASPDAGLTEGPDGNFYGEAASGGPFENTGDPENFGTIFKITPSGTLSVIYSFSGEADGAEPFDGLVLGPDGNFYGVTEASGTYSNGLFSGQGDVFKITPTGTLTTLYSGSDVNAPISIMLGTDGNLYVSNLGGGVLKLTLGGSPTLYTDGSALGGVSGLTQGNDGNFYGTTRFGGANGDGQFFQMTSAGDFTVLHTFDGTDGASPFSPPITGMDGLLYGTTAYDGANSGGTFYSIATGGSFNTLYSFTATLNGTTLGTPLGAPIEYSDGSFYGAASAGGADGRGGIYKITDSTDLPSSNPTPSIGQISPNTIAAGSGETVVTLTGAGFVAGSVVKWNGTALSTTFESATQVLAVIPSTDLGTAGTATVTVVNPTPGGGTSGNFSETIQTVTATTPATPTGLTAFSEDGYVILQWNPSAGATSYNVYMTGGGTAPTVTGITGIQYIYTGLTDGITYTFTVAAVNSAGTSAQSSGVSVRPESSQPPTSPVLTGTAGVDQIDLSWTDTGADSYQIQRQEDPAGGADTIATLTPPTTTYVDTNVTVGETYYYTIVATNEQHDADSNEVGPIIPTGGTATHFVLSTPASATPGTPFNFTVTAEDASNETATGYTGTVHFTSTDGSATLPANFTFTSGDNGTVQLQATLASQGDQTIAATDTTASSITGTSSAILVSGPATHFSVSAPASVSAGTPFDFTVTALDSDDNVVVNYPGTVAFSTNAPGATLLSHHALTSGTGTFSATFVKSGSDYTISAVDSTNSSIDGTSAAIAVTPGTATHLAISTPASVSAGTPFNFTVNALDQFGNIATGYSGTIEFSTNAPRATLPGNSALTDGTGTYSATFTDVGTAAANFKIGVGVVSGGALTGATSAAIAVTPETADGFLVTCPATVQGDVPFDVTVTAIDTHGNKATGYTGTVHFTSSDGAAVLPANSTLTDGSGTFSVTLNSEGDQTITATDTVTSSITGTSKSTYDFTAQHLLVTAPSSVTKGVSFSFTVTAVDRYYNFAPGYNGTVVFSTNAPRATLPGGGTLTSGTGTFSATFTDLGTAAANFKIGAGVIGGTPQGGTSSAIAVTP